MKHSIKKITNILFILIAITVLSFGLDSCKKEKKVPPTETEEEEEEKKDTTKVTTQDYILFLNHKIIMKNPAKGEIEILAGTDTSYYWAGNQPTGADGDTVLYINHGFEPRKAGSYTKITDVPFYQDELSTGIRWGTVDGRPYVQIRKGEYTLKRENNFWVSTLKNGEGIWIKSGGDTTFYSGIEFRATWPD
jgi:hypothetical protein